MRIKYKIALLLLWLSSYSFGQMKEYSYKRALTGIKHKWHNIILPNEIFGKIKNDISDVRILGVSKNNDTIEVPYILSLANEKIATKELPFNLINQSKNEKGYYYTLEMGKENSINEIYLDFRQENFDWKVNLEGSQNQQEWFSIIDNYRILSIKNSLTDYKFTTINFPNAKFRYFRLHIISNQEPELMSTKVLLNENIKGKYINYPINTISVLKDKKKKQTIIDIKLSKKSPVSFVKIAIQDKYDYYRPITIEYLSDSTRSPNGWIYNYSTLAVGTLNSLQKNEFKFISTTLQKLKIFIDNQDNTALKIQSVTTKGFEHSLIARFDTQETYYLIYGNENAVKPNYDIERFSDHIPTIFVPLEIGKEIIIKKEVATQSQVLFQNKIWLWVIMGLIIFILAWFSIKMIEKK